MRLPNLNALRAFDAAARHLNFRLAADELHVTQGAVAQQVRKLEADLGRKLFSRKARGLSLTEAGRSLHPPIRQALAQMTEAVNALTPISREVAISVPPSFASKWLVPRLPSFDQEHPDITLRVVADEALTSFRRDGVDIAVRLGPTPTDTELAHHQLAPLDLAAVASPDLAASIGPVETLSDLAATTLIQDGHRYWDRLLRDLNQKPGGRLLQFNQTALAMDAAQNGQGVALVPRLFLRPETDRLVVLCSAATDQSTGFHVLWPKDRNHGPAQQAVVDWLTAQIRPSPDQA